VTAQPDGARSRRRDVWAAAVGRAVPTSTPPTVPWTPPPLGRGERTAGWSGAGRFGGRGGGGAGEAVRGLAAGLAADAGLRVANRARATARDGLAMLRQAVTSRRDPARLHAKRLRRARRAVGVRSVAAAGLGWLTATVGATPGLELGEVAWGGATAVAALGAVSAGLRLAELRRAPVPAPRTAPLPGAVRVKRPPRDCPSRGPLDRLADRERALAGLLVHLGPAADEPRVVAADAAALLRELGSRITAVDRARRGAPDASRAGLDSAVTSLVGRLEAGVTAYEALVVAAADAVAAGATLRTGDALLAARLSEATDSLAGLAAGLREVAG